MSQPTALLSHHFYSLLHQLLAPPPSDIAPLLPIPPTTFASLYFYLPKHLPKECCGLLVLLWL